MTVLGTIRPDDWDLPLFLHILGAMTLVGALVLGLLSLASARRDGAAAGLRLGYRALLLGAIPAWIVMRRPLARAASNERAWISGSGKAASWPARSQAVRP